MTGQGHGTAVEVVRAHLAENVGRLHEEATRDTLTGLPNRGYFMGVLRSALQDESDAASGALLVLLSKSTMAVPGKEGEVPSHSHSHDAGAGWAYFALQATKMGYQAHGMVGFDMDRAFAELHVPIGYRVEQMICVGRRGDPAQLPEPVRARELPNNRRPLAESAFEGTFPTA